MNGVLIAISSEPKLHAELAILEQTSSNHLGHEHNIIENCKSRLRYFNDDPLLHLRLIGQSPLDMIQLTDD